MDEAYQLELSITKVKDIFSKNLADQLNLIKVTAPLFLKENTGLNDNLNGVETPVKFMTKNNQKFEVIHSLAKWKRCALKKYDIKVGHGIYTNMIAIRKDEDIDDIHSYYVDQWDWEKHITPEQRNINYLKQTVLKIFKAMQDTENDIIKYNPSISKKLPEDLFFITSQELEDKYPLLSSKEREHAIAKEKKAVFIMNIGKKLKSGKVHDFRAPDYDDWDLNGDIIVYDATRDKSLELSSMGIRVDANSMVKQLNDSNCNDRMSLPFHKKIINKELPCSIGGGIGQSRLCMFLLEQDNICKVQPFV